MNEDGNKGRVDLTGEGVHWDLGSSQSYGEYLQLARVLSAQQPVSGEHDEMMFIIVHQASELWMRLFLHELEFVQRCVVRDDLDPSFKALQRIYRRRVGPTEVVSPELAAYLAVPLRYPLAIRGSRSSVIDSYPPVGSWWPGEDEESGRRGGKGRSRPVASPEGDRPATSAPITAC